MLPRFSKRKDHLKNHPQGFVYGNLYTQFMDMRLILKTEGERIA